MLALASHQPKISRVSVRVNDEVATYLNNKKRREITQLEDTAHMLVQIVGSESLFPEHLEIECRDTEGREIALPT
jgi:ribonuclease E